MIDAAPFQCHCKSCRGMPDFDRCSVCQKLLIAGHHDSWLLGPTGYDRVCFMCAEHGAELWNNRNEIAPPTME